MAIIISKSYLTLKNETYPEFARNTLLENLSNNLGNVEKTAQQMKCSKNTIYLAIAKQKENSLNDKPHLPKTPHPNTTKQEIIDIIVTRRKETGFGKRRLRWYIYTKDGQLIPESTIGKILNKKKLLRTKKRVKRERHQKKYQWHNLIPFKENEIDTKEVLDKITLPQTVYDYVDHSLFIPRYQWTLIEVMTRTRFLAWSYSKDWSCCQVFGKVLLWWLRLFGINGKIIIWSDGGTEFNAGQLGGFERSVNNFWQPLGVDRKIIRKGHPEDNAFVERSHQTDDYEFYIPYLMNVKSEADFLKLGGWWIKVWNLYRPHMGLNNMTPYQKLRSLGYSIPKTFCLFPPLILDYLVDKKEILESPNIVQDHIDYDLLWLLVVGDWLLATTILRLASLDFTDY
jgi:hypothetical protein